MTKTRTLLAKEVWTLNQDPMMGQSEVAYTIVVRQEDEEKGSITIVTNEPDFVTGFHKQLVHFIPSIGGREGLVYNFRVARKIAQRRGLERKAA